MSYQSRGIQLSFVIHAVAFGLIAVSSIISPTKSRIITIDFRVNDSYSMQDTSQKTSPLVEKKKEVLAKRVENRVIENTLKPEIRQEKEIEQAPALPPAMSENQALVGAPEQKRAEVTNSVRDTNEHAGRAIPAQTYARPSAEGSGNSDKKKEAAYIKDSFSYIRESVRKKVMYPRLARRMGWEGKVVIAFTILSDGNAKDVRVREGCGIDILNNDAIEAVKKASPFPKPPVEAQVILPIVYKLN